MNQPKIPDCVKSLNDECLTGPRTKTKILWSKFSSEKIHEKYLTPLLTDLSEFDMCDFDDSEAAADKISQLLIVNSFLLSCVEIKNTARGYVMLNFRMTSWLLVPCVRLHLTHGKSMIFPVVVVSTTLTVVLVDKISFAFA